MSSCHSIKQNELIGVYNEYCWSPMSQSYVFNDDGTFEHFYEDDTYGQYGRGKFTLKGRKLKLNYEYLPIDSTIFIKKQIANSDSLKIKMVIMTGGLDDDVKIYEKNNLLKITRLNNDTLSFSIIKPTNEITIKIGKYFANISKTYLEINVDTKNYSYCFIEYFPSKSWYEFIQKEDQIITLNKFNNGYFETSRGKSKWCYRKE